MLCEANACLGKGGSVPFVISLVIAVCIALVSAGALVMAGATGVGFGMFLPLFAGPLAFFVLRMPVAARVHAAWPLLGFPLFIGLTIFCTVFLGATRTSSSGGGGATLVWLLPVLYASTLSSKSKCETSRAAVRIATFIVGVGLLAFFGFALWRAWSALQLGVGPAYAAVGSSASVAAIWAASMMLVGVVSVLTRPLRVESGKSNAPTPAEF